MSELSARGITYYGMLVVPDRHRVHVDPYLHGFVTHEFDGIELELARHLFVPGEHRALVAGAGLGGTSALLAYHLGVENVTCYEPNPEHATMIHDSVRVRDEPLFLRNAALGARAGEQPFWVSREQWPSSSLHREWAAGDAQPVQIQVHDINAVIVERNVNALALDLEGEERALIPVIDWSPIDVAVFELHANSDNVEGLDDLTAHILAQGFLLESESGKGPIRTCAFVRPEESPGSPPSFSP